MNWSKVLLRIFQSYFCCPGPKFLTSPLAFVLLPMQYGSSLRSRPFLGTCLAVQCSREGSGPVNIIINECISSAYSVPAPVGSGSCCAINHLVHPFLFRVELLTMPGGIGLITPCKAQVGHFEKYKSLVSNPMGWLFYIWFDKNWFLAPKGLLALPLAMTELLAVNVFLRHFPLLVIILWAIILSTGRRIKVRLFQDILMDLLSSGGRWRIQQECGPWSREKTITRFALSQIHIFSRIAVHVRVHSSEGHKKFYKLPSGCC